METAEWLFIKVTSAGDVVFKTLKIGMHDYFNIRKIMHFSGQE